jgi:hypothetical protein
MAMDSPPPDSPCRVQLSANFTIQSRLARPKRSVSLENIAWIPGGSRRPAAQPADPANPTSPPAPR